MTKLINWHLNTPPLDPSLSRVIFSFFPWSTKLPNTFCSPLCFHILYVFLTISASWFATFSAICFCWKKKNGRDWNRGPPGGRAPHVISRSRRPPLKFIVSKLHISIFIKWCTGIISNVSNVLMFLSILNPEPTSDVILLEEPGPVSTI